MSYRHQNLTDGNLPLWRHGRAWWWKLGWEWSVFRKSYGYGFAIGLRHISVRLHGLSLYVHSRDHDGWEPREFSLDWHDGCIWIKHPWIRGGGEWRSADPWWKKSIVLHVVDWLIGRTKYQDTKGEAIDVVVPMPEGCYAAKATNRKAEWRRRWYWPTRRMSTWDIEIPGGIPFAGKGENSWDCGDDGLFSISGNFPTIEKAVAEVVESVLRSRRRHGYDSKGTGKTAASVLNAVEVQS